MHSRLLTLGVVGPFLLGSLLGAGVITPASADDPSPERIARAEKLSHILDAPKRGTAALAGLTARERQTVAQRNGRTEAALRRILRDPTAGLSREGKLFYAEQWQGTANASGSNEVSAAVATSELTAAETFDLHSNVGSPRTIYLDFDGYSQPAGTAWRENGIGAGPFDAFDEREAGTQSYSAAFSPTELDYVEQVWKIVAEKYAPFDVDVTTEYPGEAALDRSSAGDTTYGARIVFTDDVDARPSDACPFFGGCAGIAWIDVFDIDETGAPAAGYFEPAWVYTTLAVPNGSGGSITFQLTAGQAANTAAHEVGHNLALEHDDSINPLSGGYYEGHADWFPLMGSSDRAIGQFDDSTYTGALTSQTVKSDVAVITGHGLPLRNDDVPGTEVLGAATSYAETGIISTRTDTDTFTIDRTCSTTMTVAATGIGLGQALDISLTVTPPDGSPTVYNPAAGSSNATFPDTPTGVDAVPSPFTTPATGLWTFTVDGSGGPGYSDYGSLGQYNLAISGCPDATGTPPGAPTGLTTTVGSRSTSMNVGWTAPASPGSSAISHYTVSVIPATGGSAVTKDVLAPTTSTPFAGLTPGVTYNVSVTAVNASGPSGALLGTKKVPTWTAVPAPSVIVTTTTNSAQVRWTAASGNPGKATATGWEVTLRRGTTILDSASPGTDVNAATFSSLPAGNYTVDVRQRFSSDEGNGFSAMTSKPVIIATRPSAPRIGTASTGGVGRPVNATVRWTAPASTGNAAITNYRVYGYKLNSRNQVVSTRLSTLRAPGTRSFVWALPAGRYKFRVIAYNRVGSSDFSAYSRIVSSR